MCETAVITEHERHLNTRPRKSQLRCHNRIDGDPTWGLGILPLFELLSAEENVFVGNNLTQLTPTIAHVVFDGIAQNNVLVGNGGTVLDLGSGNQITEMSRLNQGQPIGPEIAKGRWWLIDQDSLLPHVPQ